MGSHNGKVVEEEACFACAYVGGRVGEGVTLSKRSGGELLPVRGGFC